MVGYAGALIRLHTGFVMLPRRYWAFAGVVLLFVITAGFWATGHLHWACALIPGLLVLLRLAVEYDCLQ